MKETVAQPAWRGLPRVSPPAVSSAETSFSDRLLMQAAPGWELTEPGGECFPLCVHISWPHATHKATSGQSLWQGGQTGSRCVRAAADERGLLQQSGRHWTEQSTQQLPLLRSAGRLAHIQFCIWRQLNYSDLMIF